MAKDRVVIEGEPGEYYLQWYCADDGELGGVLGDLRVTEESLANEPPGSSDWEAVAYTLEATVAATITHAIKKTSGLYSGCYVWARRSDAAAALALIKAGVAARKANRPMPDWAVQAMAAGWKAPKGWTP